MDRVNRGDYIAILVALCSSCKSPARSLADDSRFYTQSRPLSPDPLSDHLLRGAPATSCLADAAHLMLGGHKSKSCLDPNHSIDSPVGQVCHSRSSYWTRCSHHSSTRGSPGMANILVTTWHRCLRATTPLRLSFGLNTCYNSSLTTTNEQAGIQHTADGEGISGMVSGATDASPEKSRCCFTAVDTVDTSGLPAPAFAVGAQRGQVRLIGVARTT